MPNLYVFYATSGSDSLTSLFLQLFYRNILDLWSFPKQIIHSIFDEKSLVTQ